MRGKIAIFLEHPKCSTDGVNAVMNVLSPQYRFSIFTRHELPHTNWLDEHDIVIIPGGVGDSESFHRVMKHHKEPIARYVKNGGRYLGICMGAYWAGSSYFNLLKDRDCVQFMGRPGSETYRPHPKDLEVTWNNKKESIYWYDGCSIIGSGNFKVVATYSNGDPMAGYQGRVALIGSHLEADESWYNCHSWMRKKWSPEKKNNWNLLLEFTNELMRR